MVKLGQLIKHKRFMDVAIQITYIDDNGITTEYDGDWVNLAFVKSYLIGWSVMQTSKKLLTIENKEDWLVYGGDLLEDCYRNGPWLEMKDIS